MNHFQDLAILIYCDEGGDFTTETETKHIKGHLSPGVPSIVQSVKASRNQEMLQRNSHSVFEKLNLKDPNLQKAQYLILTMKCKCCDV